MSAKLRELAMNCIKIGSAPACCDKLCNCAVRKIVQAGQYFETKMLQWYHNGDAWCWPVLHAPSYQCITLPCHTSACTHDCAGHHRPSGLRRYCLNYCGMSQQGGGGAYSEIEQSKEGIEQMTIISTLRLNMTHSTYTVMHIVHAHTLS